MLEQDRIIKVNIEESHVPFPMCAMVSNPYTAASFSA